jgi:hypothetical protein
MRLRRSLRKTAEQQRDHVTHRKGEERLFKNLRATFSPSRYTVAGRAIGFALERPLHVVAFACSASGISKQLEYMNGRLHA